MAFRADSPTPSDRSDADDELREGIEQIRRGDYRGAQRTLAGLHSADVSTAVEALRWSAHASAKLGAHDVADAQLQSALARVEELPAAQQPKARASIQLRLAAGEQRRGDDAEAERLQRAAIESLSVHAEDVGLDPVRAFQQRQNHQASLGSAWNNLGITLTRRGEQARAREAFEKAMTLREELGDKEGYCMAATNLLTLQCGDEAPSAEVLATMEEHLRTARQMGASHNLLVPLRVNLANCLEAAQAWRQAAKARRELFGLAVPEEELRLEARCEACQAFAPRLRCGRCRRVFFCTDACQRKAWPAHRHECTARDEAADRAKASRECPVCLEEVLLSSTSAASPVTVLECLHVLHSACWQGLLQSRQGEVICPVCRDTLPMSA
ncbi:unnamed protein product [Prorocentrum cordatum]|uniref:Anaphase-promoting complex subunit 11 n=1 Tax=Prorocentrum cordatum TaxID=2364126 RepID=A0ABN9U103_9DINO|nr:unnamed protein product [Polarella glacialis]